MMETCTDDTTLASESRALHRVKRPAPVTTISSSNHVGRGSSPKAMNGVSATMSEGMNGSTSDSYHFREEKKTSIDHHFPVAAVNEADDDRRQPGATSPNGHSDGESHHVNEEDSSQPIHWSSGHMESTQEAEERRIRTDDRRQQQGNGNDVHDVHWDESQLEQYSHGRSLSINHADERRKERQPDVSKADDDSDPSIPHPIPPHQMTPATLASLQQRASILSRQSSFNTMKLLEEIDDFDSSSCESEANSERSSGSVLTSSLSSVVSNPSEEKSRRSSALTPRSSFVSRSALGLTNGVVDDDDETESSSNQDDLANVLSETMKAQGIALGHALAERASCIESIKWLGQHLPESVVALLIDEIEDEEAELEENEGSAYCSQSQTNDTSTRLLNPTSEAVLSGSTDGMDDEEARAAVRSRLGSLDTDACHIPGVFSVDNTYNEADGDSSASMEGSLSGPLHYRSHHQDDERETKDFAMHRRRPRRHSLFGAMMGSSGTYEVELAEPAVDGAPRPAPQPRQRMARRASMPGGLIVRSLETSTHSIGTPRRDSLTSVSGRRDSFASCGGRDSLNSGNDVGGGQMLEDAFCYPDSYKYEDDEPRGHYTEQLKADGQVLPHDGGMGPQHVGYGLDRADFSPTSSVAEPRPAENNCFDPFPKAEVNEEDGSEVEVDERDQWKKRTRDSILKLGSESLLDFQEDGELFSDGEEDEAENFYFTEVIPPATRHDCSLLFVDISGFTKLSTTLDVEALSKTINTYFQTIVEEVEAFGGDVLKFAGDALFAEWQSTTSSYRDGSVDGMSLGGTSQSSVEPWHGLSTEECVLTAAACAARIVDKCSDFPVFADGGNRGQKVTELNVHCGVGFGEVVGVHVGDNETRMEYLILGDPIEQVAKAIDMASRGEVVASPEALVILEETAEVDSSVLEADTDKPQIIATKSTCFFRPKGTAHVRRDWTVTFQDVATKPRERLAKRCVDWTFEALKRLRHRMELYVHPVVANEESAMKVYPGDRMAQELRHRSEAELRDVFTVFIMPLITARLTGHDMQDCKVLVLLNDIMLIMTRELARFKGQLRQFIVDDKGVVLIANFGLRGSTFPNMIAKRALPFMSTVQTLLHGELSTDCQMGATFGQAYCGVVGGVARHEYAVLGPSVNLAARLMGSPANKGMLVDFSIKEKAGGRQFRALPPVKAKGYPNLVPIFEPMQTDKGWTNVSGPFVGRESELSQLGEIADNIVGKGGPSKFVLLTGETGAGKTALCVQATKNITDKCAMRRIPHLLLKNIVNEGDMFVPFSIARPIFTEIIKSIVDSDGNYTSQSSTGFEEWSDPGSENSIERVKALSTLMQLCENAEVPSQYTDIIGKLILTRGRADIAEGQATASTKAQLNSIAQYLVKAFLQCTMRFDLVVLALDDISNMDENSWEVIELLMDHSHNLMIIGTTRPVTRQSMHVDEGFWDKLYSDYTDSGKFSEIEIAARPKSDLDVLIANIGNSEPQRLSQTALGQPRGMSSIASEFITALYPKDMAGSSENTSLSNPDSDLGVGNIGEFVLHTMDALSPTARTHLNLAAILGTQFDLMDVVIVFEQYRGIQADERFGHAKSVHESLDEAVHSKILEPESDEPQNRYSGPSDHPYASENVCYKFTHEVWRSNILRLTLDEWKRNMHSLIAQSMETVMNSEFADDYLQLTKLFAHWKESGSAEKAATLALRMGRSLENVGLTRQGLVVYHEALDMWKARDYDTSLGDETVGGLSMQLLEQLEATDIEHIIRLNVALGRCYTNILDPRESIRAFQTALNLLHKAPSSVDLVDKSIIFPVLSGLFVALRFGHNEDPQYEQGLVRMFLRETRFYNDFHYSRALAMKAEMLGRHGEFEKAIQTTRELRESYDVDEFSEQISLAYGSDQSAQCISHSAQWYMCLNEPTAALAMCDYVLAELLPRMDTQNVQATFQMLYPMLWVLKDNGRAQQAKEAFDEFVIGTSVSRLDERGVTSDRPLHFPINALLDMTATNGATDKIDSYTEWFMVDKNGRFSSELNFTMGSAGRTADTITAEMCLLLARHATHRAERSRLTRKGFELARDAVELTKEKEDSRGMIVAYINAKPIFRELEEMHRTLPPDRRSRRLSVGW